MRLGDMSIDDLAEWCFNHDCAVCQINCADPPSRWKTDTEIEEEDK